MNLKNIFYTNDNEEIEYNKICQECPYDCKQSFRSKIMSCKFLKEKNKKGKKNEWIF